MQLLALKSLGFPGGSDGKEFTCKAGDLVLIPGLGRSSREGMSTHSNILAWRIPWSEERGGLQSMGSQRVGHDWAANTFTLAHITHTHVHRCIYKNYPVRKTFQKSLKWIDENRVNIHKTVTRRKQKIRQLQLIKSASPQKKNTPKQKRKKKKTTTETPKRIKYPPWNDLRWPQPAMAWSGTWVPS